MIKLKNLQQRTNKITIVVTYEDGGEVKSEEVKVEHKLLTAAMIENMRGDTSFDSIVTELSDLLVGWEIEDEEGQPLEVTQENLRKIDIKLLREIRRKIIEHTFVD